MIILWNFSLFSWPKCCSILGFFCLGHFHFPVCQGSPCYLWGILEQSGLSKSLCRPQVECMELSNVPCRQFLNGGPHSWLRGGAVMATLSERALVFPGIGWAFLWFSKCCWVSIYWLHSSSPPFLRFRFLCSHLWYPLKTLHSPSFPISAGDSLLFLQGGVSGMI